MADNSPSVRASDADRDRTIVRLKNHLAAGRLTLEEFSERTDRAYGAGTLADLDAVLADLPARPPAPRRSPTRWIVAVMGGSEKKGRWRLEGRTTAIAIMGSCDLDLRRAEIDEDEVTINAFALMGGVDVIVPEGVEVELSGFALMGGNESRVKDVPPHAGSPLVRVRAFSLMGGVDVRSKPGP